MKIDNVILNILSRYHKLIAIALMQPLPSYEFQHCLRQGEC